MAETLFRKVNCKSGKIIDEEGRRNGPSNRERLLSQRRARRRINMSFDLVVFVLFTRDDYETFKRFAEIEFR